MSILNDNLFKYYLLLFCVFFINFKCTSATVDNNDKKIINSTSSVKVENSTGENFANFDSSLENIDSSTNYSSSEETTTAKVAQEEPKLPEDLISQDVLLDPNIVLARLSRRDVGDPNFVMPRNYNYGDSNWYSRRRFDNKNNKYKFDKKNFERRYDTPKKIKIYPVFPGK